MEKEARSESEVGGQTRVSESSPWGGRETEHRARLDAGSKKQKRPNSQSHEIKRRTWPGFKFKNENVTHSFLHPNP